MLSLVQLSDCHLFADKKQCGYAQINPYESLSRLLAEVARQSPDVLLVSGDLSGDGSTTSYQHFKQLINDYGIQSHLLILPGNHDNTDILRQQFSPDNLWCDDPAAKPLVFGRWQIHLLNTKTAATSGDLSQTALQQLEYSLQQEPQLFHLVAAHHHPLPCNAWMDNHGWQNGGDLVSVLVRYPSVKAMLYGHIHHASEQQLGECRFLSSPSTCWQWAIQAQFGVSQQQAGYRTLVLADNGQLSTQIFRLEVE